MRKLVWIFAVSMLLTLTAAAQDFPRAEVFGGYSYVHTSEAGQGFSFNGASGQITVNANQWFGITGDIGVYHNGDLGVDTNVVTYLFGPKFAYRKSEKVTPYFHVLLGGAHIGASFTGVSASDSAFALAFGGGIDANLKKSVAIRVIQVDYLMTKFSDGDNDRQNNARISAGIVFRWGGK
jgi:outer membrane immunogenic protein